MGLVSCDLASFVKSLCTFEIDLVVSGFFSRKIIHLSIFLFVRLFLCLSVCFSVCLSVSLFVCLFRSALVSVHVLVR